MHLIIWDSLIIDVETQSNIRLGTLRGDALRRIRARTKMGLITIDHEQYNEETMSSKCNDAIISVREILGVSSSVESNDFLFKM